MQITHLMHSKRMIQLHAIFYGQVQGVGFRATAYQLAKNLQLNGFVRNVPDGSVEVIAIGEKKILEEFLLKLQKKFPSQIIQKIEKKFVEPSKEFSNFSIVF